MYSGQIIPTNPPLPKHREIQIIYFKKQKYSQAQKPEWVISLGARNYDRTHEDTQEHRTGYGILGLGIQQPTMLEAEASAPGTESRELELGSLHRAGSQENANVKLPHREVSTTSTNSHKRFIQRKLYNPKHELVCSTPLETTSKAPPAPQNKREFPHQRETEQTQLTRPLTPIK